MLRPSLKCGVGTPYKLNLWKLDGLYFRFFASPMGEKKVKTWDLSNTNNLIWKEARYVLIDTENESGTKNDTVTVQGTAQIWLQMIEAFSHVRWETGGTRVSCVNTWKVSREMMKEKNRYEC